MKKMIAAILICLAIPSLVYAGQGGLTPDDREAAGKEQSLETLHQRKGTAEMEKERLRYMYEVLAEPETAQHMADYAKNMFDELRKRGFSGPDALRLTANMPLPQFQP